MNKEKLSQFTEKFLKDVDQHEIEIIKNDGVYRHIRFKKPGSLYMYFDLLTWPGCLCYTGDMGTFVFKRTLDMFEFFRRSNGENPFCIDMKYFAQKVEASDRCDGINHFSETEFRAQVRDYFDQKTIDIEEWSIERKDKVWTEIKNQVLEPVVWEGENAAWQLLREFKHDGFDFSNWESSCQVFSFTFEWCCHALEWGIAIYDAAISKDSVELRSVPQ